MSSASASLESEALAYPAGRGHRSPSENFWRGPGATPPISAVLGRAPTAPLAESGFCSAYPLKDRIRASTAATIASRCVFSITQEAPCKLTKAAPKCLRIIVGPRVRSTILPFSGVIPSASEGHVRLQRGVGSVLRCHPRTIRLGGRSTPSTFSMPSSLRLS